MLEREALNELVEDTLRPLLAKFGYQGAFIEEETFPDGVPVLAITIRYAEGSGGPDPEGSLSSQLAVHDALLAANDTRGVYLRHSLPTDADSMPENR